MAKAIEKLRADGLTVGHFGLAAGRADVRDVKGAVHAGDAVDLRALGNFGLRLLGIDTPEVSFTLPSADPRSVPLTDDAWANFFDDPFDPRFGDLPLAEPLKAALSDRLGADAAANHARHAELARQGLAEEIERDRTDLGKSGEEFAFFLAFAHEVIDRYGRLLAYLKPDQPEAEGRLPSYNERMLTRGLAAPYFIWPNIDPFRTQTSLTAAVPRPGEATAVASRGALGFARFAVKKARVEERGIFETEDPLRILPFEVRYLAARRSPDRWVIDLSREDDTMLEPWAYFEIGNSEDRLFVGGDYLALFERAGWRRR
jgi:endonuclease YncB( thermonuclease family)